jgi:Bacterial protein of unknown function (DUF839)
MKWKKRAAVGAGLAAAAVAAAVATAAWWSSGNLTDVGAAQGKTAGFASPNVLSPELGEIPVAQGSTKLENGTVDVPYYGYHGDGTMVPLKGATTEATKSEPDKNTYLVFKDGLSGPDPSYDYGTHFLFQGHELGTPGYITRINLDADGAHRITLLGTQASGGAPLKDIDGSTWDPWAKHLLFTVEAGNAGGMYQATPAYPSTIDDVTPWLGRGGYEGIQNDDRGNLYVVEDVGGSRGTGANATARRPNSFVYRFLPNDPADLTKGGTIQALQVLVNGDPLTFDEGGGSADQAINAPDYVALHQYGTSYPTNWVTIATTDSSSTAPGPDVNALAKAAGATPFKRPENGQFRPGSDFTELYFDETGDTDATTSAGASGGFTGVFKLQQSPASNTGRISIFYNGDVAHAGFDNVAFFSRDELAFVEDAGDGLHTQRNALDSGYLFDVTADYSSGLQPIRFLAEGRDASATLDSSWGFPNNEGDNEITGIHVSSGDATKLGILGERIPKPFNPGGDWRVFWTQQHGDNFTWEIVRTDG